MNILDYIPHGKENAISRKDLSRRTGLCDRELRKSIKSLVKRGVPILSSSGRRGYWYSDDIDEIEEFIRESEHRCRTEQLTYAKLKKRVYEAKNIRTVPVRQHFRRVSSDITDNQMQMNL